MYSVIWPDHKVAAVLTYFLLSCLLVFAHASPLPKMSVFLPLHISKSLHIFQVTVCILSLKNFLNWKLSFFWTDTLYIFCRLLSFASPPSIVAICYTCLTASIWLTSPSDHITTFLLQYLFNRSSLRGKFFVFLQLHIYICVNYTTLPLFCRIQWCHCSRLPGRSTRHEGWWPASHW